MKNNQHFTEHGSSSPSILMYSHDGFGLGHLKRNFNIAKQTVQEIPGSKALLIMGHTSIPFHPIPYGIDFVKLPSIIKMNHESWQPRSLPMESGKFKELRASLIKNVAEHFRPDIFVVDYVPKGVWGELVPTLQFLKESNPKTKIVLGLRDVIDDPATTRQRWEKGHTYDVIRQYYDKIFIYGSPEIYDTAYHYGLTGDLEEKISYCGYLCSEEPFKSRERVRQELRLQHDHLVVITAGGGGDAYEMMRSCMEALKILQKEVSVEAIFIAGPFMILEERQALEVQAEGLPVKVYTSTDGLLNYMNAADLLITMGSYNTMMEAVRLRRPTLVIPREGPSAEQKIRARIFSELGLIKTVDSPSITPPTLAKAMLKTLSHKPSQFLLNMNGLSNAVHQLSELIHPSLHFVPNPDVAVITA
ncbi:MAG: UDP-N-acetylglucosamine--N-acetylmuramyl-(pentapeptide) pyrophosphoryl-undecaprenol N-acetylglucosamine transferase [Chlamydiae bacterium]|nr:UDP-N-acetylglucosamine--N-acetylmuramyl-(pentapeptide) pyrophosphoryl-undecaprenol N-acetylglucosamine transferase [Chlamydiota bacterium]